MIKQNVFFNLLIVYYWGSFYFLDDTETINLQLYIYLMVPIATYIAINIKTLINYEVTFAELNLIFFLLFASLYQLAKHDIRSLISITLFVLTILIIYRTKVYVSLKLLNYLFIISIVIAIISYYIGFSKYGFIPNQIVFQDMPSVIAGRISLFNNVINSLYFSFFIFTLNLFYNHTKSKYIFLLLSSYFIFFGVSRTLLIILAITIIFYFLIKKYPFKRNILYTFILPTIFLFLPIIFIIFHVEIIELLLHLNISFINSTLFRNQENVTDIVESFERLKIWSNHLNIFFSNPILGTSLNELISMKSLGLIQGRSIGTESFLTLLIVRFGIVSIFFYIFIFSFFFRSLNNQNAYQYINFYFFIFIAAFYGSFFTAYNMLFLILISSFNMPSVHEKRKNI